MTDLGARVGGLYHLAGFPTTLYYQFNYSNHLLQAPPHQYPFLGGFPIFQTPPHHPIIMLNAHPLLPKIPVFRVLHTFPKITQDLHLSLVLSDLECIIIFYSEIFILKPAFLVSPNLSHGIIFWRFSIFRISFIAINNAHILNNMRALYLEYPLPR